MKRLAIIGAGGHGKVVADTAECAGWSEVYFFDERWPTVSKHVVWPITGHMADLKNSWQDFDGICIAIGNNVVRLNVLSAFLELGAPVVNIIHPHALVSRYATIGLGSVVFAGAVINAATKTGKGCIINTSATIDHDCILGNGVHISPGAHLAGGVTVDDYTWIGIGASINQEIHIGRNAIVGAGAAVIGNIADNHTVVGVPATRRVS